MPNYFFISIEERDSEKFRIFKTGKFNKATKEILEKNDGTYVWGIHKGKIVNSIWEKIRKNDELYLTIQEENFRIFGAISKKVKNSNFGELIYPGDVDKKQITNFLFFKKLEICSISYNELKDNSKSPLIHVKRGIHEIKKEYFSKKMEKVKPKKFNSKEKKIGKSKRSLSEVWRYVRNQNKVKKLKNLYDNKCQIVECGFTFEHRANGKNEFYSEVHHYNPLKKQSDDDYENMIVLCPNHHAEFDYSVKFIHPDRVTIIDQQGNDTGETIKFHKGHELDIKNIESQLRE